MKRPLRIGIFGSYDDSSHGDLAILEGMIAQLQQAFPEARFTVFASSPMFVAQTLRGRFPSLEAEGNCGGTVHAGRYVGVSFGRSVSMNSCLRTFIHELVHVFHENNRELDEKLEKLSKEREVPVHEAFAETVTNVIAFKIGIQKEPFEHYYDRHWKKLVEVEEEFRRVLRESNLDIQALREYVLRITREAP